MMASRASFIKLFIFYCLFLIAHPSFALEQNEKYWLAFGTQEPFSNSPTWTYNLYGQLRFINDTHAFQLIIGEYWIGYRINPSYQLGSGVRWSGNNPDNDFFQVVRVFEQLIWKAKQTSDNKITLRTRLEALGQTNSNQIALRIREKITVEFLKAYFNSINPLFYDEVYIPIIHTNYTPHNFFGENRIFIGINWLQTKTKTWEIGYINQYQSKRPNDPTQQMSHILSVTYNFS